MRNGLWVGVAMLVVAGVAFLGAQATPPAAGDSRLRKGRPRSRPSRGGATPAGQGAVGPRPGVGPADRPAVDAAAADRGRHVWASECITCHGAQARGTDTAPNLLRWRSP